MCIRDRYLLSNIPENLSNAKCRVNSNTKIVQVVPKFFNVEETICEGLNFEVGTSNYNQSGIFTDSLISSLGCDSIVTLDLTVVPDLGITADIDFDDPLCTGDADGFIDIVNVENTYSSFSVEVGDRQEMGEAVFEGLSADDYTCLLYTSPSPRDATLSRMPSSA